MIVCNKCGGKVFVDLTFVDNRNYEAFCLLCGKRWFLGVGHPLFKQIKEYVNRVLVG
jgi:hypothetical protein